MTHKVQSRFFQIYIILHEGDRKMTFPTFI
nr:MAG TPA: hypothetical protein [Caudoviricetes sp.]DAP45271.1 MAG TPA: hypothetical protein [Caudoviricetes sp.]